jgi:hypothetical protein
VFNNASLSGVEKKRQKIMILRKSKGDILNAKPIPKE